MDLAAVAELDSCPLDGAVNYLQSMPLHSPGTPSSVPGMFPSGGCAASREDRSILARGH